MSDDDSNSHLGNESLSQTGDRNNQHLPVGNNSQNLTQDNSNQDAGREEREEVPNTRRTQRRRLDAAPTLTKENLNLMPVNSSLIGEAVMRRITRMAPIRELTDPDERMGPQKTNNRYIDLQILRIIVPDAAKTKAMIYNRNSSRSNSANRRVGVEFSYSRMFMCRVYNRDNSSLSGEVVYVMQGAGDNEHLWTRDTLNRDNGTLSIGSYFRIIRPEYVERYLNNECPLLVSKEPAILMAPPMEIDDVPTGSLQANDTKSFVFNMSQLSVKQLQAVSTKCTGLVCDKQRLADLKDNKCGCWNYKTHRHSLTLNHSIHVGFIDASMPKIVEPNFTSHRFVCLYMNKLFPPNLSITELQGTESIFEIEDCLDELVGYVNTQGGWTVVGWCRLGMVNDKSLINNSDTYKSDGGEQQVESGELKYHIVSIFPTNPAFRTPNTPQKNFLDSNKYNIDWIGQ